MHGSFIRRPTNIGTESSSSRSKSNNFTNNAKLKFLEEARSLVLTVSITLIAGGMCDVGSWLSTMISAGRPLKLTDLPVHARLLVSPELVSTSTCGKSRQSALFHSPYTIGSEAENIQSNEYVRAQLSALPKQAIQMRGARIPP